MASNRDLQQAAALLRDSNANFDLTNNHQQKDLLFLAEQLDSLSSLSVGDLKQLAIEEQAPLEYRLAVKLVTSKRYVRKITTPLRIGVVFAMWGEHNRLNPKTEQNPNGEDSLRMKVEQLSWISADSCIDWHLYPVDDGCPHDSADIAKGIVKTTEQPDKVTVFKLSEYLETDEGPLANLHSVDDSRKGGAIVLGCQKAIDEGADVVVYTDADNSVHLGQIGLLLEPYLEQAKEVVLGNRKHPESILVKQEERWGIGIKTLRHMQRMIGEQIFSQGIKDTQAAFKLYSRDALQVILRNPTVYDFSFDTDWILAAMEYNKPITTVPFAFIDSAAESASIVQGPMTTWYTLLEGLVKAARARHASYSRDMAKVFDEEIHSHKDLELLIDILPKQLAEADDKSLGDPAIMSPYEVRAWIQQARYANASS
ncbi:glycosyltransferase [Vibrio mediterranei]|uniref:glycosyltransferase n=1 Tax=Vibrio mediterranei TaxID=689 RepID=UPI00228359C0|nr:glycosyltransferase [Vibrio mediterranei]MCY9855829.1 glycosyltransferase [Vibrio mediterranei]